MASFMDDLGERLVDNGYPVIPIMLGAKVPGRFTGGQWSPYPDWSRHCDRPTKPFEIDIWRRWPGCAIGIPCGAVVGIDIDVLDAEVAHKLQTLAFEMLGETPCVRIGLAPKRMLVYRAVAPFAGRKRHPIEILARGQQFVAYAIHPETKLPYQWPNESLVDVALDKLPAVDEAKCAAFLDAAWPLIPDEMRVRSILSTAPSSAWRGPGDPKGTREAIAAALQWLPNDDLPGNEWITVGAAIKAALGEDGRDLWLAWSKSGSKSGKSGKSDTAERRWATLRPHSVGAGSIYWLAERQGWRPDAHLTLNGTLAEQMAQPHPAAALIAAMAASAPPAAANANESRAPYRVDPRLLDVEGTLRLFVEHATITAVSPQPFLALAAGLCMLGAVAGRRYRTPTNLRSNIYAIGIADSGGGKDHARVIAKQVLAEAGLSAYLGGEDFGSSAGLISSLVTHPSRVFQVDEFGKFLKLVLSQRAPPHKAAIWDELTKFYSTAASTYLGAEYADQKARPRITIHQPCACVYGTTVPMPFWAALEGGALSDGSLARFMVFLTDDDYPDTNDRAADIETPPLLIEALKATAAGVPGHDYGGDAAAMMASMTFPRPYIVPLDAGGHEAMGRVRQEARELLRAHRGTYATAMFGRYAENIAKLAMLAAISRDPEQPVTRQRDVEWAALLVEHCIGTLLREADRFVADNPVEAKHKKVLEIIRATPGIDGRALSRKTQFLVKREREDIIDALVESEQIVRFAVPRPGAGRPGHQFWLASAVAGTGDLVT